MLIVTNDCTTQKYVLIIYFRFGLQAYWNSLRFGIKYLNITKDVFSGSKCIIYVVIGHVVLSHWSQSKLCIRLHCFRQNNAYPGREDCILSVDKILPILSHRRSDEKHLERPDYLTGTSFATFSSVLYESYLKSLMFELGLMEPGARLFGEAFSKEWNILLVTKSQSRYYSICLRYFSSSLGLFRNICFIWCRFNRSWWKSQATFLLQLLVKN